MVQQVQAPQKVVEGGDANDNLFGGGTNDEMAGNGGNDLLVGGGGNDDMSGGAGNDTMFGDSGKGGQADLGKLKIAEDVTAKMTFVSESAGYKNALGVYKIGADGQIYDVDVIWGNASLKGSGGSLVGGESSESMDLKAGERLGFFVVPNGYSQSGMANLLTDTKASWKFVDANGNPGNVNGGKELKLVHVASDGRETDIKSQYGKSVFHSVDDGSKGLNGDKMNHVVAEVDTASGKLKIGFEDLKGGGDKDYDDSVFLIDIGVTNAALVSKVATKVSGTKDDNMLGGDGADKMFGMSGHDTMDGGAGDDRMWGNSGDDVMHGNDGNDQMHAGSGNDVVFGGAGDDVIKGNSGDDKLSGGSGNDVLFGNSGNDVIADGAGNDKVDGGSGNDTFVAGAGDDVYKGGSGFDTIDYSRAEQGVTLDLSKHTATGFGNDTLTSVEHVIGSSHADDMKGSKNAEVLDGGAGNDVIRGMGGADTLTGGEGNDTFKWLAKDVVDASGRHLGVDVITDFSEGDVLDFSKLVSNHSDDAIDESVMLKDDGRSTHVFASVGEAWVEVAVLQGVTGMTTSEMLDNGMILV